MVEFCQQDVQVAQGKQDNIRCVAQLQALAGRLWMNRHELSTRTLQLTADLKVQGVCDR